MIKKIRLAFIVNRETFRIEIDGKNIWYTDRRWDRAIKLIPKDEDFIKKILFSRGKIPNIIKDLFALTKKEKKEYDNAKDSRELADICIRDCRKMGARLLKKEVEQDTVSEDAESEDTESENDINNIKTKKDG